MDELQRRYDESLFRGRLVKRTVQIVDHDTETRWPTVTAAARHDTPVRSTMSIQLFVGDLELRTLNLCSDTAGNLGRTTEYLAEDLATHAAIALLAARRGQQFHSALAGRDVIGQEKGILMERSDIGAAQAFLLATRLSQDQNMPPAEVAEKLVQSEHPPRR
ncbi:ANTAR domain-containing protein [Gordonia sp. C13]|uniref:ANTAR domain-containing protein n=1 Tax=Gordonia sp. C13 TaxID=2935078 RepID=UPI00200A4366|nr:ANTAR domain-containing protein [Gordonia sp. C13]MCK8616600.1 ANTAR domain-containing protein [Gordonia sp. C13]